MLVSSYFSHFSNGFIVHKQCCHLIEDAKRVSMPLRWWCIGPSPNYSHISFLFIITLTVRHFISVHSFFSLFFASTRVSLPFVRFRLIIVFFLLILIFEVSVSRVIKIDGNSDVEDVKRQESSRLSRTTMAICDWSVIQNLVQFYERH